MRVLAVGDVVGQAGCDFLRQKMPQLKEQYRPDFILVNGENSAEGNGILPFSAKQIFDCGADVITTGNHGLRRREINEMMDEQIGLIRPANYHPDAHGAGVYLYDALSYQIGVVNLQGDVFLETYENPFGCMERLLSQIKADIILVDFHAEATSEKLGMGYFLDGKVSLVFGTHTHVQTADEKILPGGTGYITDIGMCGPSHSVLGVTPELAIRRMRTHLPTRFENASGPCSLSGIVADIDLATGKTTSIQRIFAVSSKEV
ncbi:MAG: TIGR00282 family metallophosphoesterase [Oscillospiraceae bacterium]|nr:TIGR00282 family metallophosphoesterase [Oscillospiraceae bacterium]MDD7040412.1 TIGR00282 family metallophosphoesterase [Oscillospiraceae bacterium]MDY2611251.1 TIGR00282 family metallophosphoesterase [Oscillospiraceae bacterium]